MAKFNIPTNYEERNVPRSTRDLSKDIATTLFPCVHVPIFSRTMLPDDVFKSRVNTLLMSNPFQSVYLGRFKFRISAFQSNLSNFYGWMDNNTRKSTKEIKEMPHWTISPYRSYYQMECPVSLLPYPFKGCKFFASVVPGYAEDYGDTDFTGDPIYLADSNGDVQTRISLYTDKFSVQPHSVLEMIGFQVGYMYSSFNQNLVEGPIPNTGTIGWSYNADKLLMYLDVIRSYMVNNQLNFIPYYIPGLVGEDPIMGQFNDYIPETAYPDVPTIVNMPLDALDKFFIWLRSQDTPGDLFKMLFEHFYDEVTVNRVWQNTSFIEATWQIHIIRWLLSLRFGGMFCTRYENDIMQNLLTNLDSLESYLSVIDNRVSVNDLRKVTRDQLENDRLAISGGRYKDVMRVIWGTRSRVSIDRPKFCGTHSFYIDPHNIASTSDTETSEPVAGQNSVGSALGQLNSYVNSFDNGNKRKRIRVSTADPGLFMYIVSLVPEVSYSTGIDEELMHNHFADDYKPQFSRLGFQDVPNIRYDANFGVEQVEFADGEYFVPQNTRVMTVGKEVAWAPYMTSVNRSYGLFAKGQSLQSFVPIRQYTDIDVISDSPGSFRVVRYPNGYAKPNEWNYMFQITDGSYPNWHLQLHVDLTAFRPIGNRYMPTLE